MLRALSAPLWQTSKDGDCTASLGNLFCCLTVLGVKNGSLVRSLKLSSSLLCLPTPVLQPRTPGKSLALSSGSPPCSYWSAAIRCPPPQPFLLQARHTPFPQNGPPLLTGQVLQPPGPPGSPPLHSLHLLHVFLALESPKLDTVFFTQLHER